VGWKSQSEQCQSAGMAFNSLFAMDLATVAVKHATSYTQHEGKVSKIMLSRALAGSASSRGRG
jgi:hypothetical protein